MLDAVVAKLGNTRSAVEGAPTFARLLLQEVDSGVAGELGEAALADLANGALDYIREKPAGGHKLRHRRVGGASVIEIVNDDMPFLVDSVMGEVQAHDCAVKLVLHPIFKTKRSVAGVLQAVTGPGDKQWQQGQESFIQVVTEAIDDGAAKALIAGIDQVLVQVRAAVADWRQMLARVREVIETYRSAALPVSEAERQESIAFLEWLEAGNFTFLGIREFNLTGGVETGVLDVDAGRGLGILRDPAVRVLRRGSDQVHLTPEVKRFYQQPTVLTVAKANTLAKVHRRTYLDYVGAKTFDADGRVAGEVRIVGLFTSGAYTRSVRAIPFLRRKADRVIAASGFPPDSHNGKSLLNVIETFPRDELFQIPVDQLETWALEILDLDLRPRVRVFPRIDEFDRFVTALVYVPRDRFSTDVRVRIAQLLAEAYQGTLASFTPHFMEGTLVRIHLVISRNEGPTPRPDRAMLEDKVRAIVQSWQDRFAQMVRSGPAGGAAALVAKYGNAFSAAYREAFGPERALQDIGRIESLSDANPVAIDFYADDSGKPGRLRVALYRLGESIPLEEQPGGPAAGWSHVSHQEGTVRGSPHSVP